MNVHHRYRHPNDPDGIEPDYFGVVAEIEVCDFYIRDLWLDDAWVQIVGTGGLSYRVDVIKIGDGPVRELDFADHWDRVIWDEVVKRITDEDVAEAFERG